MRELVLRVPARAVEEVLDRLLPLVPGGVREVPSGEEVELKIRGHELPSIAEVVRAVGRTRHRITEATVPDDWRERRLSDYRHDVIGGRLVVRPDWAPQPGGSGLFDIVLGASGAAFGAGKHPTTRACLELLLDLPPIGGLADLGTGTGVLAILAAKLGWHPVVARDVSPESLEAARTNAAANGVELDIGLADLSTEPPPPADGISANIPGWLHGSVAAGLSDQTQVALVSGFGPDEAEGVLDTYASRGLLRRRMLRPHGWVVALLARD